MDSKVTTVVRQSYSLFDALAQAGGLMGVIYQIFNFILKDIQAFLFQKNIIRESFVVTEHGKKKAVRKKQLQLQKMEKYKDVSP